jgi:hypothetical protein
MAGEAQLSIADRKRDRGQQSKAGRTGTARIDRHRIFVHEAVEPHENFLDSAGRR